MSDVLAQVELRKDVDSVAEVGEAAGVGGAQGEALADEGLNGI